MSEILNNYWQIILFYSPLGIIGIWRWSIWIFKKILALRYKPLPVNKDFKPSLSIVTPVYNEDSQLFLNALTSWKENQPEEIIAVIDQSDTSSIGIFKKFIKIFPHAKLVIFNKPGKRPALAEGIRQATGEIIALVDSDTIWGRNIRNGLLSPFADPSVGGVGPRQQVLKPDTLARRLFSIYLDNRYNDELTYLAASGNALTCLSGRTALYRRRAIVDLVDKLVNETFLGRSCISGDDKCLTNLVQEKRWKVRYQANLQVLTPGAADLKTFFKQQLRWSRNSWRADIKTIFSSWIWKEKFLHFHLIDRFIQPFTLILGPIYFVFSLTRGDWLIAIILIGWWHLSRTVKIFPHLKKYPRDFLILPFYVISVYLMVLIKIYALFTLNEQGWITRWDKNRLNRYNFFRLIPAYTATASMIFLIVYGNIHFRNFLPLKVGQKVAPQVLGVSQQNNLSHSEDFKIDGRENLINNLNRELYGYYEIQKKDTLSFICRKFNCDLSQLIEVNKEISDPNFIHAGQVIKIPIAELRHNLEKEKLLTLPRASIDFDAISRTINLTGNDTQTTLSDINQVFNDKNILEQISPKEWLLKANLLVGKGVTLVLDGNEVSWLKLKSDKKGFIWLRGYQSDILISNTKITSWDEENKSPDFNFNDGRSFVQARSNGRMDILNSELAYLGYRGEPEQGEPFGGVYGISWRLSSGTFNKHLITGSVIGNIIHDNYFGLYTYGATGMVIRENEVYNNAFYGIDPHDDSNNLIIESNSVHDNGKHGIIISKRVFNSEIKNNKSYNNQLHGIMLDRQSNNNLVENNQIFNNHDGIAIYGSNENYINHNIISNNLNGIRVNNDSLSNLIEDNDINNNRRGIFLYNGANNNVVTRNNIEKSSSGVYIKNASNNFVFANNMTENDLNINLSFDAQDNYVQKND